MNRACFEGEGGRTRAAFPFCGLLPWTCPVKAGRSLFPHCFCSERTQPRDETPNRLGIVLGDTQTLPIHEPEGALPRRVQYRAVVEGATRALHA